MGAGSAATGTKRRETARERESERDSAAAAQASWLPNRRVPVWRACAADGVRARGKGRGERGGKGAALEDWAYVHLLASHWPIVVTTATTLLSLSLCLFLLTPISSSSFVPRFRLLSPRLNHQRGFRILSLYFLFCTHALFCRRNTFIRPLNAIPPPPPPPHFALTQQSPAA